MGTSGVHAVTDNARLGVSRASLGVQLGYGIVRTMYTCEGCLNAASRGHDAAVVLANCNPFKNVPVPRFGTKS